MKILVTGGTGYIGSKIVEQLLKKTDAQIVIGTRNPSISQDKRLSYTQVDFNKNLLPDLKDIDLVVNASGILYETPESNYEAIHVTGPVNLLKKYLKESKAKDKCFINISMKDVDMEPAKKMPFTETKSRADHMLLDICEKENASCFILRPSVVIGSYRNKKEMDRHAFPSFAATPIGVLVGGLGVRVGGIMIGKEGGKQFTHPISAREIGEITANIVKNKALYTKNKKRMILKLVGPQIPVRKLFEGLRVSQGKKPVQFIRVSVPVFFARFGAKLLDIVIATLNKLGFRRQIVNLKVKLAFLQVFTFDNVQVLTTLMEETKPEDYKLLKEVGGITVKNLNESMNYE